MVYEKPNHIKEELIHASKLAKGLNSSYKSTLAAKHGVTLKDGNQCHPLERMVLKINKLQPFLVDIDDLYKDGMKMTKLHNRNIILPFSLKFESHEMIQSQ